jgi:uncharacterized repeat protein (TIGR03843 family)
LSAADAPVEDVLALLRTGSIEIKGRMPWSSNGTYLTEVCSAQATTLAVYKPGQGERPLWDFPPNLYKREVAAFALSEALGWSIVPETIIRLEGPLGEGSLQRFVPADFAEHYFTLYEADESPWHDQLRRICLFDLLANNTDRKGGHCLRGDDGRIYAIDNGLSFAAQFKLRTVIWEFAGERIPKALVADVETLLDTGLPPALDDLLDGLERDALLTRARAVVRDRRFPFDPSGSSYPWPLV